MQVPHKIMAFVHITPAPVLPSVVFLSLWCFESNPTEWSNNHSVFSQLSDPVTSPAPTPTCRSPSGAGSPLEVLCSPESGPVKTGRAELHAHRVAAKKKALLNEGAERITAPSVPRNARTERCVQCQLGSRRHLSVLPKTRSCFYPKQDLTPGHPVQHLEPRKFRSRFPKSRFL